ncbi:M16 family metallopeptidase [Prauserella endophytica]|uniref:Insulinase family protein n=1 Tax=Prauserella endophytica TaxID=1592324 RepID=A0ABY2RXC5_9PSEU|nr:pitrilysin family protein [Prauserella endophytica]TKG62596.1 insulinase family protein [Prauserella endophytica]
MARRIPGHEQPVGSTRTLESVSDGAGGSLVRRTVLPGGLRVVTESVPGVRSATVGLWVGIGSRDEQPSVAGAAHYLEHLLFKGTGSRDATQIAEEIDAVGGEFNAFTAKEHTCYYAQVLDEDLPLAVDLVTDVVFDARCADSDVDTERSVVLEEIAMRDDDPEDLLHDTFVEAILDGHALGRSVLGTEASITGMSPAALRGFYKRRYRLPKMVLAVAGNVEHGRVLRLVRKALRDRLSGSGTPVAPRQGRARVRTPRKLVLRSDDTEQAHVMLGLPALSRHDERRFTLSVLNAALGGGMSSRLFQEIRERRGLAYQVYSSVASYADTGHLAVYAGCQPERLGEVTAVTRQVLAEVAEDGLTEAEVARAKGQLRGGLVLGMEDTASRMTRLGKNELNYGHYLSVTDTVARIDAVTAEDVAALARALLRRPGGGPTTAVVVGPYAHDDDLPKELHEVIA